jgi:hypothetical protein
MPSLVEAVYLRGLILVLPMKVFQYCFPGLAHLKKAKVISLGLYKKIKPLILRLIQAGEPAQCGGLN